MYDFYWCVRYEHWLLCWSVGSASSLHPSDELYLKKINKTFIDEVRKSTPRAPQVLQPIIIQIQNERTPMQFLTASIVTEYFYRATVKESKKD